MNFFFRGLKRSKVLLRVENVWIYGLTKRTQTPICMNEWRASKQQANAPKTIIYLRLKLSKWKWWKKIAVQCSKEKIRSNYNLANNWGKTKEKLRVRDHFHMPVMARHKRTIRSLTNRHANRLSVTHWPKHRSF